jgi:hypothetical protein
MGRICYGILVFIVLVSFFRNWGKQMMPSDAETYRQINDTERSVHNGRVLYEAEKRRYAR